LAPSSPSSRGGGQGQGRGPLEITIPGGDLPTG
jgi:hypothetical protein